MPDIASNKRISQQHLTRPLQPINMPALGIDLGLFETLISSISGFVF